MTLAFFFGGWFLLSVALALWIGAAIREANDDDRPEHVSVKDWDRVTHVPHTPGFQRERTVEEITESLKPLAARVNAEWQRTVAMMKPTDGRRH